MKFTTKKVFEWSEFSTDIRDALIESERIPGNDCCIPFTVNATDNRYYPRDAELSRRMIEAGAVEGEVVLIDVSW